MVFISRRALQGKKYLFRDIHTFSFSVKIQNGRQKWRKSKFFPFAQDTLVLPCGSKICSKSLYLLRFSRYSHFFIFRKDPGWPPKVAKIEIFPLCTGHSCTTLWVKNSLEIALTHLAMEIHLQTTDHVVAVEKVAEQHIGTQLCSFNTFEDTSHLLIMVIIKN